MTPSLPDDIASVFAKFDPEFRQGIEQLRALIFDVASQSPAVGPITESLKWGTPSYQPLQTKSGTPIRLGQHKSGGFAMFTHCQTTVISDFQNEFPFEFRYEGNRAILFKDQNDIKPEVLRLFINSALTYHIS